MKKTIRKIGGLLVISLGFMTLLADTTSAAAVNTVQPDKNQYAAADIVPEYDRQEENKQPGSIITQEVINGIARSYGAVGVAVAVVRHGLVDETYSYGSATIGVQGMTADTKLRVASLSKVVLAMVAMRLREAGDIELDGDISKYWGETIRNPNYKNVPVTIRFILSHASSIKAYEHGIPKDGASVSSNLRSGAGFNRSVPGSMNSWCYNNYGFAVLGLTLEKAADETINSIAARELFQPLGISASFGYTPALKGNLATLYFHNGSVAKSVDALKSITGSTCPGQSGKCFAGGLLISASDLAKLVVVLANDGVYEDQQLLTPESVALMQSVHPQRVPDELFYQGLPLRFQSSIYGQEALFYHTGSSDGVYNLLSYNPVTKNGVVVLTTGASAVKDSYGIYKICGDISNYIYMNIG